MRIALVQMAVAEGDVARNTEHARELLAGAPAADIYLLPELLSTGYAYEVWEQAADTNTPATVRSLAAWAASRKAWVGCGLITRHESGGLTNRFWMVPPSGLPQWYDKGHLFVPLDEHVRLVAGKDRVQVGVDGWSAGLSICFDLRFPEMYRLDAVGGVELFLVVSAWPEPRCAALATLSRARAVENQCFLALCNRVGPNRLGAPYCGGSFVVAPDGTLLAEAGREEQVVIADLDRTVMTQVRDALPVLRLRAKGLDW